jgi:hypothetical protein
VARFLTAVNVEHQKSPTSRGKANLHELTVAQTSDGNIYATASNKHKVVALKDFETGDLNLFPVSDTVLARSTNPDPKGIPRGSQMLGVYSGYDLYTGNVQMHVTGCNTDGDRIDVAAKASAVDEEWIAPYWCVNTATNEAEANMVIEEFVSTAVAGTVTIPMMTNTRAVEAKDR